MQEQVFLVCTCADTGWECRHCLFFLLCSDALACGSVPASVYFHCVRVNACISSWVCEYACASVHSLNAHSRSPRAGVCGSKSKGVSVCVSTLICELNADLSIKADLACVLPTDMPVITTRFYCSPPAPKGAAQPLGQVDGDTHTFAHTNFKSDCYEGVNVRGGAWGSCNHSVEYIQPIGAQHMGECMGVNETKIHTCSLGCS